MKERPILFSASMVRAILAGTKTQTRRLVKPQPENGIIGCHYSGTGWAETYVDGSCSCLHAVKCPYGAPGDRLYVKETWGRAPTTFAWDPTKSLDENMDWPVLYRADGTHDLGDLFRSRWFPSIHMPRWASRLTLEVTEVRVQRLQDISEEDARAEGVCVQSESCRQIGGGFHRDQFAQLWDSINGQREGASWAENPWVWAISFKRVEASNG